MAVQGLCSRKKCRFIKLGLVLKRALRARRYGSTRAASLLPPFMIILIILILILCFFDLKRLKQAKYLMLAQVIIILIYSINCRCNAGALLERWLRLIIIVLLYSFHGRCVRCRSIFPLKLAIASCLLRYSTFILLMALYFSGFLSWSCLRINSHL
jgi:hypothetical protein